MACSTGLISLEYEHQAQEGHTDVSISLMRMEFEHQMGLEQHPHGSSLSPNDLSISPTAI
eukprot:1151457-Pelagomonas_calceolata.AAC.9